jgi:hypothetical protein
MEFINNLFNNPKFVYSVGFLLALYISFIQNRLSQREIKLFYNKYLRVIYLIIIIFILQKSNIIGMLLVIVYLTMSSSLISEQFYVKEKFVF